MMFGSLTALRQYDLKEFLPILQLVNWDDYDNGWFRWRYCAASKRTNG